MKIKEIKTNVGRSLHKNSPSIFTGIGIGGVLTTAYLASKATFKIANDINSDSTLGRPELSRKEKVKKYWPQYIPTAISAGITIGCIVSGARIGNKRAAAAYSLLSVSEKAFTEYKEKVVEQIGAKKEQTLRDEIAQDKVNKTLDKNVVVIGNGNVLCFDMFSGRYFNSDMETLRKSENTINAKLIRETYATVSDFYYLVGLPYTTISSECGWNVDKMLELRFSTVMSEDGRPCIAYDFNYTRPI